VRLENWTFQDAFQRITNPLRRLVQLEEAGLLAAARRRTRLGEFHDTEFREPLSRLLKSLEGEACLTVLGRIGAREDFTQMLANRLAIEHDREAHPEIAAVEIRRPLFITGLPRTGSTFLHGLLAQDPSIRVPLHWETRSPSLPDRTESTRERQIARCDRQIRWFYRLAPEFRKIHPVAARMPEECVVILSHSFLSFQFSSMFSVPSYQAWLEEQDLRPAYRFHRKFLQHLQWQRPGARWLLKAPPHLPGLEGLCAVYPDAGVIMTHRDPLEVVASVSSLHAVLRRTFSKQVDPQSIGTEVSTMLVGDIQRGLAARDNGCAPPDRYLDVRYTDLVTDPMATVRRIYRQFELSLSHEAEERMARYLARTPKDEHGEHVYSLAQFGLDPGLERERYRGYRDRFGV